MGTELCKGGRGLPGTVPSEIRALLALTFHSLHDNNLSGELPPELCNLTSLVALYLHNNSLADFVLSSLRKLSNLHS